MVRCDNCKSAMIFVGTVRAGQDPGIYAEAYVCPARGCSGYGAIHRPQNSRSQWPGMTLLTSLPLHARIAGALEFKRGLLK
jgi:hypothetical protein